MNLKRKPVTEQKLEVFRLYQYNTGICTEKLYLYLASDLEFVGEHPDEGEIIKCYEYKFSEVFQMINDGTINDAKTICALSVHFVEDLHMIKMIATDIDGTILKWGLEFTPAMKDCVEKLKQSGIKLVLVTGRMHCATLPVAKELGLDTPIISYQGGLIKDCENNTLYQKIYQMIMQKKLSNGQEKIIFI